MSLYDHPTDDQLLDLVNDLLLEPARGEAIEHVRICGTCAARLRDVAATHARAHARAIDALASAGDAGPATTIRRLPLLGLRSPGLALAAVAILLVVVAGVLVPSRPP